MKLENPKLFKKKKARNLNEFRKKLNQRVTISTVSGLVVGVIVFLFNRKTRLDF